MRAVITVPATSCNLGAGFDVFGLALQIHNDVEATQNDGGAITITLTDGATPELLDPKRNLVARAYRTACEEMRVDDPGVNLRCINRIPFARGLGSSAAAALGGTLAACALHGGPWDEHRILDHVTSLEGHRDNASAALLGGLTICAPGAPAVTMAMPDEISTVLLIPEFEMPTSASRSVVPQSFSRADAIYNASRCALFIYAIAHRKYPLLRRAMEDRWHQEQRTPIFPQLPSLINAALDSGAHGAALSGAGSTVIAVVEGDTAPVEAGLLAAAEATRLEARAQVVPIRNWGARVDVHAT